MIFKRYYLEKKLVFLTALFTYLQMFAINYKDQFGISMVVITILFLFFIKLFTTGKGFSKVTLIYLLLFFLYLFLNYFSLTVPFSAYILRVFRYIMLILIVFSSIYIFQNKLLLDRYLKYLSFIFFIGMFYGLYQYIAPTFHLPYFLNIFSTNVSFSPHGLFYYYGGWNEGTRIYGVTSEPSFYGAMLILVFIYQVYSGKKTFYNYFYLLLIIINIVLTFSRLTYLVLFISILIMLVFKKVRIPKSIIILMIILLPFIMYYITFNVYNLGIFEDASMFARFLSQKFYFDYYLDHFNAFGLGLSSITHLGQSVNINYVEEYAHNAFVQIIVELGIIGIVLFYIPFINLLIKVPKPEIYTLTLTLFLLISFGEVYSVESFLVILVSLYLKFSQTQSDSKQVIKDGMLHLCNQEILTSRYT